MEKLIHYLIPRESNNHKAKILHPSSLIVIVFLLIIFQGTIGFLSTKRPDILGYASNISIQEVVNLTNQRRAEAGLTTLTLNQNLSAAAYTKAQDMISRDYWAHVAPDGTQPWKFFNDFGYKYRYAGENLARDFSNATDAVNAWMNSPSHRENIMNPKYKEIGIGITEGDLAGSDTTIIVQFFGATYADKIVQPVAQVLPVEVAPIPSQVSVVANEVKQSPTPIATSLIVPRNDTVLSKIDHQVLVSPFTTTKNTSLIVILLLIVVFIVDAILVSRRKITRIAGRTFSHVAFLLMILAIIMILKSGKII